MILAGSLLGVGTSKLDQQVAVGIVELSLERARFLIRLSIDLFWLLTVALC